MAISFDHIRPGDLITANFMNGLLDELKLLEQRVATLEDSVSAGGAVKIFSVVPAGGIGTLIRVGQDLQILGINFGFTTGSQRVYFDSVRVDEFRPGSNDTRLTVPVPPLPPPDLPEAGRPVALRIENVTTSTSDTLIITILPVQRTLQGDVDVIWIDSSDNPSPDPIVAGQAATFAYHLRSRATLTADYTITPIITVMSGTLPPGLTNLQVLDKDKVNIQDRRITLDPGQTKDFFIRIPLIPAGTTGLAFNLSVTATSANLSGNDQRPFTVGTHSEPSDANIQLVFDNFSPSAQFDSATNTISLRQGVIGTMNYQVTFKEAGTFDVTATLSSATNWEIGLGDTPAQYIENTPNVTENPQFKVRPGASASATGQAVFSIIKSGQTVGQTRRYRLVLIP